MKITTLKELKDKCNKNKGEMRMCFTSCNTVWWASDWNHLHRGPVPLDMFNSPLFQHDKTEQFFDETKIREHAKVYGKHPVTTWTMAHAENLKQLIEENQDFFPGQLKDVSSGYTHFGEIVSKLVDAGKITNLDEVAQ